MVYTDRVQFEYANALTKNVQQGIRNTKRDDKLYQACQDFEAIFVKEMLKSMKSTVQKSGLLDGGFAEEIYDDMLYDEYAKKMTKTASFGITESLYKQLSRGSINRRQV